MKPENNYAAIFPDMKVGHVANFEEAVFLREVNLSRVHVGLELRANNAKFYHQEKALDAIELKVGTIAYFEDADFLGPVNFAGADIGGIFNAAGAGFHSTAPAIFSGIKVGELAQFTEVEFRGPVLFSRAEVGGKLITKVEDEKKEGAIIRGAVFGGEVSGSELSFADAKITDLELQGTDRTPFYIHNLDLKRLRVDKDLSLESATVINLEAANLQVIGQASLKNTKITHKADFSYSSFGTLKIEMNINDWPPRHQERENIVESENKHDNGITKEAGLILDGMEYKQLLPRETRKDREELTEWINHSRFDVENYFRLEKYFGNLGYESAADDVFITMKDRELTQIGETSWYNSWLVWLGRLPIRLLWGKLAGYGHKPFRTFWLGLTIILLGAIFVFDPKYLQVAYLQNWHLDYELTASFILNKIMQPESGSLPLAEIKQLGKLWLFRLITSFDQFIPLIDLEMAKKWQPPDLSFRGWCFLYFQRISGWILVPIGLAAIYSQFK